jgi:hypothetical protein
LNTPHQTKPPKLVAEIAVQLSGQYSAPQHAASWDSKQDRCAAAGFNIKSYTRVGQKQSETYTTASWDMQ